MKIHFRKRRGPIAACGVGWRWSSQNITSVASTSAVTCGLCRRTKAFRKAVAADRGRA